MRKLSLGIAVISCFALAALSTSCSPEEYGPCSIPKTVALKQACFSGASPTCTSDYVFDCDSLLCGVYQGSAPFCTHRCVPATCPAGQDCSCPAGKDCKTACPEGAACVEWVRKSTAYYCLPQEYVTDPVAEQGGTVQNP